VAPFEAKDLQINDFWDNVNGWNSTIEVWKMIFLFHLGDFQRFHANVQVGKHQFHSSCHPTPMYEVSEKIGLAYYINKNTFATFQKKTWEPCHMYKPSIY